MSFIPRSLAEVLLKQMGSFPVVSLTGPRQSGKTTLLQHLFPHYQYFNLERIDYRTMILSDPMGFLRNAGPRVIFDEVQNVPELFSYIQVISDERSTVGQYILSGSQSFLLNERIAQSLAGRAYISRLFPFDLSELPNVETDVNKAIYKGFYPRLLEGGIAPEDFYPSYISTYVERDIRSLRAIEQLNSFTRFLGLCAGRIGQVLNLSGLANDAGITVNTAKAWLSLLEASYVAFLLPPYYNNFNKRLIKAPKLYFYDTGLACALLQIRNYEVLLNHYLYGALFENLVIAEIVKRLAHKGQQPSVYYWRESNGTEIDCIMELEQQQILALEIKGGATFNKDFLKNLRNFPDGKQKLCKKLIYAGDLSSNILGVDLIGWPDFVKFLKTIPGPCSP